MPTPSPGPLLTVRATLVLLIAIIVGSVAGGLSYLAQHNVATSVLVAGGAAGGALVLFQNLIDH